MARQLIDVSFVFNKMPVYMFDLIHVCLKRSRLENPKVKYLKFLGIFHGHAYFQTYEIWLDKKQTSLK